MIIVNFLLVFLSCKFLLFLLQNCHSTGIHKHWRLVLKNILETFYLKSHFFHNSCSTTWAKKALYLAEMFLEWDWHLKNLGKNKKKGKSSRQEIWKPGLDDQNPIYNGKDVNLYSSFSFLSFSLFYFAKSIILIYYLINNRFLVSS